MQLNKEIITSKNNELIKKISTFKDKKIRRTEKKFIAEGLFVLLDIKDISLIDILVLTENALKNKTLSNFVFENKLNYYLVNDNVLAYLSETVTPQGVLFVACKKCENKIINGNILILDNIQDPGNAGTIIRTCVALGVDNILALNSVDLFSEKVVRSSMGGIFNINVFERRITKEYSFSKLREELNNHNIISLDMDGENIFNFKKEANNNYALIVGSESQGVSKELKCVSNIVLTLPMKGKMQSLNASIAAGIAMYFIFQ